MPKNLVLSDVAEKLAEDPSDTANLHVALVSCGLHAQHRCMSRMGLAVVS